MNLVLLLMGMSSRQVVLSLPQTIELSRDSAFSSMVASERQREVLQRSGEARSRLLPRLELSASQLGQSSNLATFGLDLPGANPYIPFHSIQDLRISGSVPLVNMGLWSRWRESGLGEGVAALDREAAQDAAGLQGGLAWLDLARAELLAKDRQAGLALATRLRGMTQDQVDAGAATRLDLVRAQSQELQVRRALSVALMAREHAQVMARRILHLAFDDTLVIDGPLQMEPTSEDVDSAGDWTPPAVRSALSRVAAADAGVATERRSGLPQLAAFANYGFLGAHLERDGLWTGEVGVVAKWEVFDGLQREAKVGQAESRRRMAQMGVREAKLAAELDERDALTAFRETSQQLVLASQGSVLADTELVLAREKFAQGASGNAEVVLAQGNLTQAHTLWIEAAAAHQAAVMRLRWARGDWKQRGERR